MSKTKKLLGEGAYGCVFDSPLECINGKQKKKIKGKVGKVFSDEKYAKQEIEIYNVLDNITELKKYIITSTYNCDVAKKSIPEQCTSIHDEENEKDTFKQLTLGPKGLDLMKYCNDSSFQFLDLLPGFINIARALVILEENKFCHHDIKPDNIIMIKKKMVLIDFGSSLKYDDIFKYEINMNKWSSAYMQKYPYYPPEIYCCRLMSDGFYALNYNDLEKMVEGEIIDRLHKTIENIVEDIGYSVIERDAHIKIFNEYYLKLQNTLKDSIKPWEMKTQNSKKYLHEQYTKYCANKVDVYSFGITMLQVFTHTNCMIEKVEPRVVNNIVGIIKGCLYYNPVNRLSPIQLRDRLIEIQRLIKKPKNRKRHVIKTFKSPKIHD